jgi:hypothetical protein
MDLSHLLLHGPAPVAAILFALLVLRRALAGLRRILIELCKCYETGRDLLNKLRRDNVFGLDRREAGVAVTIERRRAPLPQYFLRP